MTRIPRYQDDGLAFSRRMTGFSSGSDPVDVAFPDVACISLIVQPIHAMWTCMTRCKGITIQISVPWNAESDKLGVRVL